MEESGKRRSFAQRVGTKGENAFRTFSERQGLIPNKVEEDFGVDFICQIDMDHESIDSSPIGSAFVGACVRATTSKGGKVVLNRGDAQNLLNVRSPLIFVLVQINGSDRVVYHRAVDLKFSKVLANFLSGDHDRMSIRPKDCLPESKFPQSLAMITANGYVEALRLARAQSGISKPLPHAGVEIRFAPTGQLTIVTNPDYFEYFSRDDEDAILRAAFSALDATQTTIEGLVLKPQILESVKDLPGTLLLGGGVVEEDVTLEVRGPLGTASAPFVRRHIGSHHGYANEIGYGLVISAAKEVKGRMVHETQVVLEPSTPLRKADDAQSSFLELCSSDAQIFEGDRPIVPAQTLADSFALLPLFSAFFRDWERCARLEGWVDLPVKASDALDEETFNSIAALSALLTNSLPMSQFSFVLETGSQSTDVNAVRSYPAVTELPILLRVADTHICAWLQVHVEVLTDASDLAVGIKFFEIQKVRIESLGPLTKSSIYPEIAFEPTWPTLIMGPRRGQGVYPEELGEALVMRLVSEGVSS